MSKGLEALKEHIIALKSMGYTRCEEWLDLIVIEKELKALEIIKEKELNIFFVKRFVKRYNRKDFNYQCRYEQQLTQEEYDLLKEVLLCH